MLYALLVSTALSIAAFVAEHAGRVRGGVTRWAWVAALVGSLVLPTALAFGSLTIPDIIGSTRSPAPIVLRDVTSIPTPGLLLDVDGALPLARTVDIDTLAQATWVTTSAFMVSLMAAASLWLRRRKRGWREARLCGERVLVASDAGPAVVGIVRSRIVVPAWLLQVGKDRQRCAIAHERSHLSARDPQVVALALAVVACMPWNPWLWWQFHRLRRAIEIDCDARVLRDGHDPVVYCETLLHVGRHRSRATPILPAMSASASFLERRIRQILRRPGRWARVSAATLGCVASAMAVVAAQVTPPGNVLDRYTGFYEISPISLVTVEREGNGLTIGITGQVSVPHPFHVVPTGDARFAVEGKEGTTVRFVDDAQGRARSIRGDAGRTRRDRPAACRHSPGHLDPGRARGPHRGK